MSRSGGYPWSMRITQTDADLYYALWIRDALDLAAGSDPLVPGHLTDRPPCRSHLVSDCSAQVDAGWQAWWTDLARAAPAWDCLTKYWDRAAAPYFDGLADWPHLQDVTRRLWGEADRWFNEYKRAVMLAQVDRPSGIGAAAHEAANRLGHPIGDIDLDLIVLPVEGAAPLEVNRCRYIVPTDVFEHPAWHDVLVELFVRAH
jgi:hypothetical protein